MGKNPATENMTFQQSTLVTRNAIESPLSEEGKVISRSYKQPEPRNNGVGTTVSGVKV
jgi:hypothetical protein